MPGNKLAAETADQGFPQTLSPAWAVSFSGGGSRGWSVIKGESETDTTRLILNSNEKHPSWGLTVSWREGRVRRLWGQARTVCPHLPFGVSFSFGIALDA